MDKVEIRKNLIHEPSEGLTCVTPSKTQQQFKDECDVNNIIDNYTNTGIITHFNNDTPVFGDYSQIPSDYGEAVAMMERSREEFEKLPAKVRARFDNNPLNLVKFVMDENNREEAVKLGLVVDKALETVKNDSNDSVN